MPEGQYEHHGKQCYDHLGNEYTSESAMCRYYNLPLSTFNGRMDRGWTLEQALTVPNKQQGPKINHRKPVPDHKGKIWPSVGAMCKHWKIPEKVYWSRKRLLKWPLEKILTTPVNDPEDAANAVPETDHTGRTFKSISAMCRHWKIKLSTYRERRKRGWSIERALTTPEKEIGVKSKPCTDHLGKPYPSKNAMCHAYGTNRYAYESRLALGWTQEQALTGGPVISAKPCSYKGIEFPASVYLAIYLGFPKYALQRAGDPENLIPGLAAKYWAGRKCGHMTVRECVEFPWFLARSGGDNILIHFDRVLEIYHRTDMLPVPESDISRPSVQVKRLVEWPWYLTIVDGGLSLLSYDDLIRLHHGSNYGLSKAIRQDTPGSETKQDE